MANVWQAVAGNKTWRITKASPIDSIGSNGDFWLNDSTGDLYERVNGAYVLVPLPGGGGGAVSSVFGRTGAVVAQPGDYTASDVGLGNVTNDAQLKRAAGDFATFSAKSSLDTQDVVLVEDSAASGAKKSTTVAALRGLPRPLSFVPPPSGFDTSWDLDPMTMTDPDLANNGWTVSLTNTPYTTLTRAGDVVMYESYFTSATPMTHDPTPAAGTYRSTIVDGRLLVQIPRSTDVSIWRATDDAARVYGLGIGGGSRDAHVRQLLISNGAPGSTNVVCYGISDTMTPQLTAAGVAPPLPSGASAGAAARHFGIIVPDCTLSGNGIGRWLQTTGYDLWSMSAPPLAYHITDTQFGVAPRPVISRIGLRLRMEFITTDGGNSHRHIEIYYLRRQPWPANWR